MLFAGISQSGMPGGIRAYPIGQGASTGSGQGTGGAGGGGVGGELSAEFQEYGCLSLAVSCMVLNHDGSLLFVGGEDGVLAMYCVADDPKAAEKKVGGVNRKGKIHNSDSERKWQMSCEHRFLSSGSGVFLDDSSLKPQR